MARRRRNFKIDGSEYTFGGGSAATTEETTAADLSFVKIARGHPTTTNVNHRGFIKNGSTVEVALDQNVALTTPDQYFYFDNAFETGTGSVSYDFTGTDTALPAGITVQTDNDSTNTDTGYWRIYGTPTAVGDHTFKVKVLYPNGRDDEQIEFFYRLRILPVGYKPVFSGVSAQQIVWNTVDEQILSPAVTTGSPNVTYTISNVSGFAPGVTPQIGTDGRVYVENIGNISRAAQTHTWTVTADLGEYGTYSETYSANLRYGYLYGSQYFGPGNAKANMTNYQVVTSNSATHLTTAQFNDLWDLSVTSGALTRRDDSVYTTSPYPMNSTYGLSYQENPSYTGTTGIIGPGRSTYHNTSSDGYHVKFFWTVPPGVESFSVVAVGAGSMGAYTWSNDGGGAGGMAWVNGVTCTPGEQFEIAVGLGRRSVSTNSSYWAGSTWMRRVNDAGYGANEWIVIGYGGGRQNSHVSPLNGRSNPDSTNLAYVESYAYNNSRDPGGAAASMNYGTYAVHHGGSAPTYGGGGAAGYQGHGANSNNSSLNGSGGSAGSGGYYSSTYGCPGGGGVGLDGQGSRGSDGVGSGWGGELGDWQTSREADGSASYATGGGGGSGGTRGMYGENNVLGGTSGTNRYSNGGVHGGGGGGSGTSWGGGAGAPGGIRMIWGMAGPNGDIARAFPSTYTTEDPDISDSTAQ